MSAPLIIAFIVIAFAGLALAIAFVPWQKTPMEITVTKIVHTNHENMRSRHEVVTADGKTLYLEEGFGRDVRTLSRAQEMLSEHGRHRVMVAKPMLSGRAFICDVLPG